MTGQRTIPVETVGNFAIWMEKGIRASENMTPMAESRNSQKFVGAVEGAMKILRYLAQAGMPHGVATIAKSTQLNTSTTFNILKTLQKEGVVAFDADSKAYSIGAGLLELSIPLLGRSPNELIRPLLAGLAEDHRVLIAFWLIVPSGRIVLSERIAPNNVVRADMEPGARLPALAGAVGRCIAAHKRIPKSDLRKSFAQLRWQNPPGFEEYWNDVLAARDDGYAFDMGNLFSGLNIAASIICDGDGTPRFGLSAITIVGQTADEDLRVAARGLRAACRMIERNIFGNHRSSFEQASEPMTRGKPIYAGS